MRIYFAFFIFSCLFISLLSSVGSSHSEKTKNTLPSTSTIVDSIINLYFAPNDIDNNKIHDELDKLVKQNAKQTRMILIFDDTLKSSVLRQIQSISLGQAKHWSDFSIVGGEFYLQDIPRLIQLPGIKFIEPIFQSHATLLDSTQQSRVRPFAWDLGYKGLSHLSTAICDTGIDETHPDFAGRVIAWQDFVGEDANQNNDEYADYIDRNGHGTQVASILAGSGNRSDLGFSNITASGRFPSDPSAKSQFYMTFLLAETQNFTIDVIFHGTGEIEKAELLEIASSGSLTTTEREYGSVPATSNFTWTERNVPPGKYLALLSSNAALRGNTVSIQLRTANNGNYENYPKIYQGIAPQSRIVALKVLDDYGTGNSEDLLDAFDWIKTQRDEYNISVVNLSLGFDQVASAVDKAIEVLAKDYGLLIIAAAGNLGSSSGGIKSPASAEEAITVGAVNAANEVAYYSSVGSPTTNFRSIKPDILAPGGSFAQDGSSAPFQPIIAADSNDGDEADDLSTDAFEGLQADHFPHDYYQGQGTSMAAPHAAGVAQLLIQALSTQNEWNWSFENVLKVKMLMSIATFEVFGQGNHGGETYHNSTQEPNLDRIDKDYTEGWGAIAADAAISAAATSLETNESVDFLIGNGVADSKVFVRKMPVSQGAQLNLYVEVPGEFDLDLLVFAPMPNSYGEPLIVGSSTNPQLGTDETVNLTAATTGDYFIAVRWISGSGLQMVKLHTTSDFIPPSSSISHTAPSTASNPTQVVPSWTFQAFLLILGALVALRRKLAGKITLK
ncbi:MAG: S8 family serine peptidase [Candidatus Hodarchaeota archaeon]